MASTSQQNAPPLGCLAAIGNEESPVSLDWYVLFKAAGSRTLIGFVSKADVGNMTPRNIKNKSDQPEPEGEDSEDKTDETKKSGGEGSEDRTDETEKSGGEGSEDKIDETEKSGGEGSEDKTDETEKSGGEGSEDKTDETEKSEGEGSENKNNREKKKEQKKAESRDSLIKIRVASVSEESAKNPLYATLEKLLKALPDESLECRKSKQNDMSYVMFNDQLPTSPGFTTDGSSKGVIAFEGTSGFFLTHSAPGFPKVAKKYEWPDHLTRQAHLFVCLSVNKEELEYIADRLVYASPLIYASSPRQSEDPLERLREGELAMMPRPVFTVQRKGSKPPTAFIFKHQSFNTDLASEVAEAIERPLIVFSGTSATRSDRLDIVCTRGRSIEHVSGSVSINGTAWLPHAGGASWAVSKSKDMFCLLSQGRTVDAELQSGIAMCLFDEHGNITSLLAPKNTRITRCK